MTRTGDKGSKKTDNNSRDQQLLNWVSSWLSLSGIKIYKTRDLILIHFLILSSCRYPDKVALFLLLDSLQSKGVVSATSSHIIPWVALRVSLRLQQRKISMPCCQLPPISTFWDPPRASGFCGMLFTSLHESLREFQKIENLGTAAILTWLKELALSSGQEKV